MITVSLFCCRYHFFLQLKRDIVEGRLVIPYKSAVLLASYAVQCKCTNHVIRWSLCGWGMSPWWLFLGLFILVPCPQVNSLQLIWRSGTRRWNLRVPDLQMSCNDLTRMWGYQDGSHNNDCQVTYPAGLILSNYCIHYSFIYPIQYEILLYWMNTYSQIPQCTILWQKCAHFCYKIVHCGICDWCIEGFVQ